MATSDFQKFITDLKIQNPELTLGTKEKKFLSGVFKFGLEKHADQTRANGDLYFTGHCVPVALKIAGLGSGIDMIAAGLLHDTIEDTKTTYKEIEKEFGKKVAGLVDGVSKLGKVKYQGNDRHVESLRKFFVAIANDVDVIVIKLCDRWHNLETLHFLSEDKQIRIARESILIHAQLASRLGMGQIVSTLNDLAFPFAFPKEFSKTKTLMEGKLRDEDEIAQDIEGSLVGLMIPVLGYQPEIDKRIKGIYSLYKKLEKKNWNIDEIYDLISFRVIVEKTPDCYVALGAIHSRWRPVPGRVKDYIALPKPNGYQSLHTAVFSGSGPVIEIQIRTTGMHLYNEYGIAAHGIYKMTQENGLTKQSVEWLNELGDFQQFSDDGSEYLESLTTNFFSDRIFVLTPKGDVIDLPYGATVLDFAYLVHSEIGNKASKGRVDGKIVPLNTKLRSQQIVNIITSPKEEIDERWLDWATTSQARSNLRRRLAKS